MYNAGLEEIVFDRVFREVVVHRYLRHLFVVLNCPRILRFFCCKVGDYIVSAHRLICLNGFRRI